MYFNLKQQIKKLKGIQTTIKYYNIKISHKERARHQLAILKTYHTNITKGKTKQ
jgi:hypothetical protein